MCVYVFASFFLRHSGATHTYMYTHTHARVLIHLRTNSIRRNLSIAAELGHLIHVCAHTHTRTNTVHSLGLPAGRPANQPTIRRRRRRSVTSSVVNGVWRFLRSCRTIIPSSSPSYLIVVYNNVRPDPARDDGLLYGQLL